MTHSATADLKYFTSNNRNTLLTSVLFVAVFWSVNLLTPGDFSYFDLNTTVGTGGTLALAAMGQALVIISGGLDLSAGAVISLVNAFVATNMTDSIDNQIIVGILGIAIGGAAGAFNGFFIAFLRIPPIVVTLATLFIIQGIALLVSPTPGGYVAPEFIKFFNGTAVPGLLPSGLIVIAAAVLFWFTIKNSKFGVALYATGSDEAAAQAAGIRIRRTKFITYVLAGCFYGLAGLFISAQSGGADPLVGAPMLLPIFAAVVLGGTSLGGGRGGLFGAVIGSYLLMMFINVLLLFSLPTYLAPIADGTVLILAVLIGSIGSSDSFLRNFSEIYRQFKGWSGNLSRQAGSQISRNKLPGSAGEFIQNSWLDRNRETLKSALPSYVAFILIVIATWIYFDGLSSSYLKSLLILSAFLGILAFGQSTVIISGGLDLSVPWNITLCATLFTGLVNGSDASLIWTVPTVLLCGAFVGAVNGIGISVLGMQPIVMTLAANGILQGVTLFYTGGSPSGFAPPAMRWLFNGSLLGITPVIWLFAAFILLGTFLHTRTQFGRKVFAIGNNLLVAKFSGIGVRMTLILAYVVSGVCAAAVGILLAGFNGAANLGMGEEYLLPSIAVVVAGGVLITGGKGHYLGVIGGVFLVISLQILISGTMLPDAMRGIIFGFVMLGALLALQQRRPG